MKRTQLYLDDQLWSALRASAQIQKTTVSDLVRNAIRDRYLGGQNHREKAMTDFVGSRKSSSYALDAAKGVRNVRRGSRMDRMKT